MGEYIAEQVTGEAAQEQAPPAPTEPTPTEPAPVEPTPTEPAPAAVPEEQAKPPLAETNPELWAEMQGKGKV